MVTVPPSTFTLLDADPLAEADDPDNVIVVADDVSVVPASSAELEASSTETLAPRMSETLAPVDAVATEEEIVVHVVSDSLELEAPALPEAEEIEQPAARAIAARSATAPVARRRSRFRGLVVIVVVFMVSGLFFLGSSRVRYRIVGGLVRGAQAALAVVRVAPMLSSLERSVPNRSASSWVRVRYQRFAGSSGWSSAMPVAYFEMRVGR